MLSKATRGDPEWTRDTVMSNLKITAQEQAKDEWFCVYGGMMQDVPWNVGGTEWRFRKNKNGDIISISALDIEGIRRTLRFEEPIPRLTKKGLSE